MQRLFVLARRTEAELQQACADYLLSTGLFTIGFSTPWETRREFCRRVGISERTFTRRMRSRHVPVITVERGPGGKLVRLRSNPEFERYMLSKRPPQSLSTLNPQLSTSPGATHGPHIRSGGTDTGHTSPSRYNGALPDQL